jgi:uncharacterized protein (DUF2384 family)
MSPQTRLIKDVPLHISDSEVLDFMHRRLVDWRYFEAIRSLTEVPDQTISDWLNLSVKTLREYRKPGSTLKENVKEHVLLLLALIKHGIEVMGSSKAFDQWLTVPNFFFDGRTPGSLLNTVSGIRFVNDRLIAMEHGDNV